MRKLARLVLVGLTITWAHTAFGESFTQLIQKWKEKYQIVLYEEVLLPPGPNGKIGVRFASLDKKADLAALVKECVVLYSKLYPNVWCYGYDNLKALERDVKGPESGGTIGVCWLYRAERVSGGNLEFFENIPAILEINKCPRP